MKRTISLAIGLFFALGITTVHAQEPHEVWMDYFQGTWEWTMPDGTPGTITWTMDGSAPVLIGRGKSGDGYVALSDVMARWR